MNCPKCGNPLSDNASFCGACGERIVVQYTAQVQYQKPVKVIPELPKDQMIGKNKFLLKYSQPNTKWMAIIAWVLSILTIALLVISYFVTLNTAIIDIPVVDKVMELGNVQKEYTSIMSDLRESRNDLSSLTNVDTDVIKKLKDFQDTPSLNNAKEAIEEYNKTDFSPYMDNNYVQVSVDFIDNIVGIAEPVVAVSCVVIACLMAIGAVLILVASILRNSGLAVTGAIFSIIYALLFTGIVFLVFIALLALAAVVLYIITNIKYGKYKKTFYIPKNK